MDIEHIITHILNHPKDYPGLHLQPQPRSNPSFKPLEPASQMQVI